MEKQNDIIVKGKELLMRRDCGKNKVMWVWEACTTWLWAIVSSIVYEVDERSMKKSTKLFQTHSSSFLISLRFLQYFVPSYLVSMATHHMWRSIFHLYPSPCEENKCKHSNSQYSSNIYTDRRKQIQIQQYVCTLILQHS